MPAIHLTDRAPEVGADELVAAMCPPPRFDGVRFDTYLPDPAQPSQSAALASCREFAGRIGTAPARRSWWRSLTGGERKPAGKPGLYLDGVFGVGKTHLLAAIWHAVPAPKAFGTFVELTHLVGALGFAETVRRLSGYRLLAIDEFELDDPGDTMLVTRLIAELTSAGVCVAATSNTLPDRLGEGRFAAGDFLREIHAMAERFEIVRVDGADYRHRGLPDAPDPVSDAELLARASAAPGASYDDFDALCAHLGTLHPSRYGKLVEGVSIVHLRGVRPATGQDVALRLVSFADRLYDRAVPVVVSGTPVSKLFTEEMLRGGYRKKYLRAISRLISLSRVSTDLDAEDVSPAPASPLRPA
ncbi:cell division protein ZapE [Actinoalloteichus hymeniacidonis]|uniref:ATPase n=1 Tax=Actinoalloteichus hymeniacidonis TaxID=340345 RepID=A0AAC9HSM0_9PSEU|nr:cell division protein ZapE [Actinoalloteichus hymeniacidonis]AOS64882.1 putative ATPase [Actinoalloteichus hymeniacidonis]MBB5907043.1 cell division protein ZapE [Actinoalloteichus hymeniacidonis]